MRPTDQRLIHRLRNTGHAVHPTCLLHLYEEPHHLHEDIRSLDRKGLVEIEPRGTRWRGD